MSIENNATHQKPRVFAFVFKNVVPITAIVNSSQYLHGVTALQLRFISLLRYRNPLHVSQHIEQSKSRNGCTDIEILMLEIDIYLLI